MSTTKPDAVPISNQLSLAAVKIFPSRKAASEPLRRGGHASGFFWQVNDDLFLITNWHNVCAWDPISDKALSDMGFTPNCVQLNIELGIAVADGRIKRDFRNATIDLFDDNDEPTWLEHPEFGRRVDVVALKIGQVGDANLNNVPLNQFSEFVDFQIAVSDDVAILGYPLGLDGGPQLPIWKRGSIATEPHYDLEGLPKLLVDTATRQGMSGGPVIAIRRGFIMPRGASLGESYIGTAESFLGVYSGRVGNDALGAQLGVVWKGVVVDEICRHGVRGQSPFD